MTDRPSKAPTVISWQTVVVIVATLAMLLGALALTEGGERDALLVAIGAVGTGLAGILPSLRRAAPLVLALFLVPALPGCGASALRTHQTIATVARVAVVAAQPALRDTCDALLARCTDDACEARVGGDCEAAGEARDIAHAAVRTYVGILQTAAHADEGQIAPALDVALVTLARTYADVRAEIERRTGYRLPELPPAALAIVRALAASVVGGGS